MSTSLAELARDPRAIAIAVALAAFAVAALLVAAGLWWRAARRSRLARARGARAVRGERAAEALLVACGYAVEDRQVALVWPIDVGDDEVEVALRADYLVRDGDRLLVAEVKTGDAAPLIGHAPTRRQLLEYLVAYQADGVLLVDVEAGTVAEVDFFVAQTVTQRADVTGGGDRDAEPELPPRSAIR